MLDEPRDDPERLALDRAVAQAVAARLAAGPRASPDADALALRALLAETPRTARSALLAVWGRMRPAPLACGPWAARLAADRWGLDGGAVAEAEEALKSAGEGRPVLIDIAVGRAWWGRLLARPELAITGALPDDGRPPLALLVTRRVDGNPLPTGDDRSFWVTDSTAPDARLAADLAAIGFAASPLAASGGLKLFMLAGYVQADDPRLGNAPGRIGGVIGAAPQFPESA